MKTALLLALGVLFLVTPTPYAQEDEDLDAELDASGAAGGMPPQMNEDQMKQQQMIMKHIFETVTESCRNEINIVVQLPPEEQQSKGALSAECRAEVDAAVEDLKAQHMAAAAAERKDRKEEPASKTPKPSKTPRAKRAPPARAEDSENFAVIVQVSIVLLIAVGGFVAYVYSSYKAAAPADADAPAPISRKAVKMAAKAAKAGVAGPPKRN